MARYFDMVEVRLDTLDEWFVKHIPQEDNGKVDALARVIANFLIQESIMLLVYLKVTSSIIPERVNNIDLAGLGWMEDIMYYFQIREVT